MKRIDIYVDGSSRISSKSGARSATIGVVFSDIHIPSFGKAIGAKTNNEAEYTAVIEAMHQMLELHLEDTEIRIYSDSLLVVQQINERWKINYDHLRVLNDAAKALIKKFRDVRIVHVRREHELLQLADSYANEAHGEK